MVDAYGHWTLRCCVQDSPRLVLLSFPSVVIRLVPTRVALLRLTSDYAMPSSSIVSKKAARPALSPPRATHE